MYVFDIVAFQLADTLFQTDLHLDTPGVPDVSHKCNSIDVLDPPVGKGSPSGKIFPMTPAYVSRSRYNNRPQM
jgi:hypothetical protein